MKWTRNAWLFLFPLAALGCGDAGGSPSAGDGGGFRDATILDAAWALDARGRDAAPADAGARRDASGPSCPWIECNPVDDTCTDSTVCRLEADGAACVEPGAEPVEKGGACESPADCAEGLTCFRRGDGGVCARPCCPSGEDVCTGDEMCHGSGTLVDGTESGWWQCVGPRPCQPLAPGATCEPEEGCYITNAMGETDCRPAGDGDVGEACAEQTDCQPGLFCAGLTSPTCVRICSLGDAGTGVTCPAGEGNCRAYGHSPSGTGLCTVEMAASAR